MSPDCPNCCGELREMADPEKFECRRCDSEIFRTVVEDVGAFKRVAESGGPAAEIAKAALDREL